VKLASKVSRPLRRRRRDRGLGSPCGLVGLEGGFEGEGLFGPGGDEVGGGDVVV